MISGDYTVIPNLIQSPLEGKLQENQSSDSEIEVVEYQSIDQIDELIFEEDDLPTISPKKWTFEKVKNASKKTDFSNSLELPPIEYLRRKSLEELNKKGFSASGQRAILKRSGENQYYVQNPIVIGKGNTRTVFEATLIDLDNDKIYPNHTMGRPKQNDDPGVKLDFEREKTASKLLRKKLNPSIIDDFIMAPAIVKIKEGFFANAGKKAGKTLDAEIPNLSLKDKLGAAFRIGTALTLIHEAGITHLDIKPDNILLLIDEEGKPLRDELGRLKFVISDFGASYTKKGKELPQHFKSEYTDPKLNTLSGIKKILKREEYKPKFDNYMLGLTLLNLFSGQTMKEFLKMQKKEAHIKGNEGIHKLFKKLEDWKSDICTSESFIKLRESLGEDNKKLISLIESLLNPNPKERPSLEEAIQVLDDLYKKS